MSTPDPPERRDDGDMPTPHWLKLTPMGTAYDERQHGPPIEPQPERPERRQKSTGHYALDVVERMSRTNAKADARQFETTVKALQSSNTGLRLIVFALVVALLTIIAGLLGVGVTGKVPGVGEVQIVAPEPDE